MINDLYCYDLNKVAPQLFPMTWELFYYEESEVFWSSGDIQRIEQFTNHLEMLLRFMEL